jgi:membrane dipeptidase
MNTAISSRAKSIHKKNPVIDALGGFGFKYADILSGCINATNVTLAMYPYEGPDHVLNEIKRYYSIMEMNPDKIMLVETAEDILKAKHEGKLGIIFGFQNACPLATNVTLLPVFYKLGVRIIQLTYNEANALGCGCLEPNDTGLTSIGIQFVQAMNRTGILIDLSHTGYNTSRDAIELSVQPVAFTHANPLALKNIPRNRPDDLIRLLAKKGGVIGLTPYASFCKSQLRRGPTMNDYVDQIDYIVQLVGIDHVGIGTDKFEGRTPEEHYMESISRYPKIMRDFEHRHVEGFSHISHFPRITDNLLSRGYSDNDCAKIIGRNFYELFNKVWSKPAYL